MDKDFVIMDDEGMIWLVAKTENKTDGFLVTKADLNKLKAVIEEFLRKSIEEEE